MSEYELRCFSNGRIYCIDQIEAPDDSGAIHLSQERKGAAAAELWLGDEHVQSFEAGL